MNVPDAESGNRHAERGERAEREARGERGDEGLQERPEHFEASELQDEYRGCGQHEAHEPRREQGEHQSPSRVSDGADFCR